ncbi:thiamine phosphate synthase [Lysinibacillus sp. NPDC097195]|uniref:thiamine phosphate synthase n=1 Tax=Lysinibacillus sp. NPDC097195 TaxID=3364141 RepID=UPI003825CD16
MKRRDLQLYFIMGTTNVKNGQPLAVLEAALQAGITMFQFREKGLGALTDEHYENFARQCQSLCKQYAVPFIVNDDIELALKLDADGIHIGQEDLPVSLVRQKIGQKILGVSVHCADELQVALQYGADYVGIGPIYATTSKNDAQPPSGTEFLSYARKLSPQLPIVAIGGIDLHNAYAVLQAGADGVAVISAICESNDINKTVTVFKALHLA